MPTIGETLREARMRQKLDIADVERQTKIRAKYLRALENEEFGMLPGPTFVKTFLRTYAEVLGLDPHALVDAYRASYEPHDELETLKPLGPPGSSARDRRRGRPRPWIVAVLLVTVVIAGLVALGLSTDDEKGGGNRAAATENGHAHRADGHDEGARSGPAQASSRPDHAEHADLRVRGHRLGHRGDLRGHAGGRPHLQGEAAAREHRQERRGRSRERPPPADRARPGPGGVRVHSRVHPPAARGRASLRLRTA